MVFARELSSEPSLVRWLLSFQSWGYPGTDHAAEQLVQYRQQCDRLQFEGNWSPLLQVNVSLVGKYKVRVRLSLVPLLFAY